MVDRPLTNFWKENNFLVTGGNGFLGKHLIYLMVKEKKVPVSKIQVPNSSELDLREKENC